MLVADEVLGYIVDIVGATRHSPSLQLGVSPRGATALLGTARSWAWLSGRNYVTPDDVKAMARPTLRHRVAAAARGRTRGRQPRRRARRHPGGRAGAALVILTGRAGLVALLCVLPIAFSPWPATAFAVLLACAGGRRGLDVGAGGQHAAACASRRSGDSTARLGQPVDAVLVVETSRAAAFAGVVRDAWAPSARAEPRMHPVNIAAGQRVSVVTTAAPGAPGRPGARHW